MTIREGNVYYKRNRRDSNIELLRFLLMVGICMLHILDHGKGLAFFPIESNASILQLLSRCLFAPCVPGFIFISGYYGVKLSSKIIVIFVQAFLIFHVFNILHLMELMPGPKWNILLHFDPISTHIWWFLTEYICLVIISPIINSGIEKISKKQFVIILCGLFLYDCLGLYINGRTTGSDFLFFLFVYLLARYIHLYYDGITLSKALVSLIFVYFVESFIVIALYKFGHNNGSWWMMAYCNPLIILIGVSYFFIFKNFKLKFFNNNGPISKIINWSGSHCLSIYLVTAINMWVFTYWAQWFDTCFLGGVVLFVITIITIMLADTVLLIIIKFLLNRIVIVVNRLFESHLTIKFV